MKKIFVYGTLRKGSHTNKWYLGKESESVFIDSGRTKHKYTLFVDYAIPSLCVDYKEITHIVGDIYSISDKTERILDRLEGIGLPGGYIKIVLPIILDNGSKEMCLVYVRSYEVLVSTQKGKHIIEDGDYVNYNNGV